MAEGDPPSSHRYGNDVVGMSYRRPTSAPLRKLTVDLIKTYRKINEVHHVLELFVIAQYNHSGIVFSLTVMSTSLCHLLAIETFQKYANYPHHWLIVVIIPFMEVIQSHDAL